MKEYVFIGNAQNKTRDFINQIIKENKDLQHQNSELKNIDDKLSNALNSAEQRIDKAIEYINSQMTTYEDDGDFGVDCCCDGFKLLSILQGEAV